MLSPEDGGYSVTCPAMPGAVSQGDSKPDALRNIVESMEGWWMVARDHGEEPLEETPELVAKELAFVLGWRAEEGLDLLVETAIVNVDIAAVAA